MASRVVIVGGGFAGIGAAHRLSSCQDFKITLLEASSQLGGRVCSICSPDSSYAIELGATYIHGEEGNSLYEIARKKGMALKDNDLSSEKKPKSDNVEELIVLSNGEEIPQQEFEYYFEIVTFIIEELVKCAKNDDWSIVINHHDLIWAKTSEDTKTPPANVTQYVRRRFHQVTADDHANLQQQYPDATWRPHHIMECLMREEAVTNGTPLSLDVDIPSYGEFEFPLGDPAILVKGGYKKLVKEVTQSIMDYVQLNKEVTNIQQVSQNNETTDGPVVVTCSDGSVYHADHVIITVSLGVLKKWTLTTNSVFSPPLPMCKLDAVHRLGFGVVYKVALEFSQPLVPIEYRSIKLCYLNEDELSLPPLRDRHTLDRVGDTNIWMDWFCGENAVEVASLTDKQLAEEISQILEKFLGHPVERPKVIRPANWASNPHFLGSYSYNTPGTNHRMRDDLAEPIDGSTSLQLLFAGEATHSSLYSTTNGAYDTGVREAERLLKHYNSN